MSIPTTSRLTYQDYRLLPDDGNRHEIIDGVLYTHKFMSPSPAIQHQRTLRNLTIHLTRFVSEHSLGEVLFAPFDIYLSDENVVQPDLFFIASNRKNIITNHFIKGAPDLVIEILSPGNRRHDEIIKRKLYERYGVQEYWIVDPELETVKTYQLQHVSYSRPVLLSKENEDLVESPLFPDLCLYLDLVF